MRVLQEDANNVTFEDYPAKPSLLIAVYTFFSMIILSLQDKNYSGAHLLLEFFYSLLIALIVYAPFLLYFNYRKKHPLTVSLNRQKDLLNISGYSLWQRTPIMLPLSSIVNIAFEPVLLGQYTIYKSCRVTVFLANNTTFSMMGNIFYFEAYERMAKKIADFISVDFTSNNF